MAKTSRMRNLVSDGKDVRSKKNTRMKKRKSESPISEKTSPTAITANDNEQPTVSNVYPPANGQNGPIVSEEDFSRLHKVYQSIGSADATMDDDKALETDLSEEEKLERLDEAMQKGCKQIAKMLEEYEEQELRDSKFL